MRARWSNQELDREFATTGNRATPLASGRSIAAPAWLLAALAVAVLGACSGGENPGGGGGASDGQTTDGASGDLAGGGGGGAGGADGASGDSAGGGGGGAGGADGASGDSAGGGADGVAGTDGAGGGDGSGADGAGGGDGAGSGADGAGGGDGAGAGGTDGGGGAGGDGGPSTDAGSDGGGAGDGGGGPVGATACVVDTAKGIEPDACPVGQICKVGAGVCKGMLVGECVTKGNICPAIVAPVCDCTGTTWNNVCEAQNGGAIVASGGACGGGGVAPKACGGKDAIACAVGEICDVGCGEAASGVCIPTPPEACPPVTAPQCGCDGNTWPNACARHHAGVALKHDGACKTGPSEVACKLGPVKPVLCQEGYYCMIDELNSCAGKGHCKPMPVACTKEQKQVCGCDQMTYGNACMLAAAGWSQASSDPCP